MNSRPLACKATALPTELQPQGFHSARNKFSAITTFYFTFFISHSCSQAEPKQIIKEPSKIEMHDEESQLLRVVDLDESSKTSHLVFSLERR